MEQWFIRKTDQFIRVLGSRMKSMDTGFTISDEVSAMGISTKGSLKMISKQDMDSTYTSKVMNMMESGRKIERKEWGECNSMMDLSTMVDGLKIKWMEWGDTSIRKET